MLSSGEREPAGSKSVRLEECRRLDGGGQAVMIRRSFLQFAGITALALPTMS
jgi:hypothetical protein